MYFLISCFIGDVFLLQSSWIAGEFRDCNGESNGTPLPLETRQAEAICSGEATREDFVDVFDDGAEKSVEDVSAISSTSSSIDLIGLPPLESFPTTSESTVVSENSLYLSPGSKREGRKQKSSRLTSKVLKQQNGLRHTSQKKEESSTHRLKDRLVTEILQIQSGFAKSNREASNIRNWSGWRGFTSNSSRSNGYKIRRGRFKKVYIDSQDLSQLDLLDESRRSRQQNSSCEWDLVKGGCRLLNSTSLRPQTLTPQIPSRIRINSVDSWTPADKLDSCEANEKCSRLWLSNTAISSFNDQTTEDISVIQHNKKTHSETLEQTEKQNQNSRIQKNFESTSNFRLSQNKEQSKRRKSKSLEKLLDLKVERETERVTDQRTLKKEELFKRVEKEHSNKDILKFTHENKRKEHTENIFDNVQMIKHETKGKKENFQKALIATKTNQQQNQRKSKKSEFQQSSRKANYPNGWAGPKPNCAWDGPGACQKQKNKKKPNKQKQEKFIDKIAAISNFRKDNKDSKKSKLDTEAKKAKLIVEEKINKLSESSFSHTESTTNRSDQISEDNVIIEKSRFINLFPKRLKPIQFASISNKEISEERTEKTTDPFDRSNLFPGKTIRERIKENLRQRERERNKLTSSSIDLKLKKIPTTTKPFIINQSSKSPKISKSSREKEKKRKKEKKKQPREGRVGFQIWSVEEWLRRG